MRDALLFLLWVEKLARLCREPGRIFLHRPAGRGGVGVGGGGGGSGVL